MEGNRTRNLLITTDFFDPNPIQRMYLKDYTQRSYDRLLISLIACFGLVGTYYVFSKDCVPAPFSSQAEPLTIEYRSASIENTDVFHNILLESSEAPLEASLVPSSENIQPAAFR